jgi:3-dehydroquinate synthase
MAAGAFQNLSKLEILSQSGKYKIHFTAFNFEDYDSSYFLCDSFFETKLPFPAGKTVFIESSEINKSLSGVESVLIRLSELGMTKKDNLLVVGGGCLQDIGTLTASIFMRGISWTYIPTTLAAMGDSCIGGKSSINAGKVKNLVGNFYPPQKVIIDTGFCASLPQLEIIAGISEIIKICFARANQDFQASVRLASTANLRDSQEVVEELVLTSLKAKKYFVEEDEFDTGIRKLLNFGHSFGHALEAASKFAIPHGVAVMVGMIAAINHPAAVKSVETDELKLICINYLKTVASDILKPMVEFDLNDFGLAIQKDKKNSQESLVLVLPGPSGLVFYSGLFTDKALEIAQSSMAATRIEVINEIR